MRVAYSYVRFSSGKQQEGDSLRRQVALAEEYAKQNGLVLDRKLKLADLGVSSFRGTNATTGALSTFLRAIKEGKVAKGSILLVENLDRLSRDEIGNSVELLLGIIRQGVEVVTLTDRMRFNQETINVNPLALTISLFSFYRAHEESALKSRRLSSVWANKREHAAVEKMTSLCPAWLALAPDRKSFKLIPDRAAIVRQIFKLTLEGHGRMWISRHLNKSGVAPWGRGHGWHASYIQKILCNRAVVGEFQPHKLVNGKYEAIGSLLPNYYPAAVEESTFAKAQQRLRHSVPGPVGEKVTNLFTGLVVDGFTDHPMKYTNKGTKKTDLERRRYLVSDAKRFGLPGSTIHYPTFEAAFLGYVRHLDWQEVFNAGKPNEKLKALEDEIAVCQENIVMANTRLKKLMRAIEEEDSPPKSILTRIQELETEQETLNGKRRELTTRRQTEEMQVRHAAVDGKTWAALVKNANDYETRLRLREEIRRKVKQIKIYGKLKAPSAVPGRGVRSNPNPSFEIEFVNGVTRHVSMADFRSADVSYTLETNGEQIPWVNEPVEETNPKPIMTDRKKVKTKRQLISKRRIVLHRRTDRVKDSS